MKRSSFNAFSASKEDSRLLRLTIIDNPSCHIIVYLAGLYNKVTEIITIKEHDFVKFHHVAQDLVGYQALLVHLDILVPRAIQDQVVKEEEREPQVPQDPRVNEAAEDYQDPPDLQARLVNQHNVKQVLVMDVS